MTFVGDPMFLRGLIAGFMGGLGLATLIVAACLRSCEHDDPDTWKGGW